MGPRSPAGDPRKGLRPTLAAGLVLALLTSLFAGTASADHAGRVVADLDGCNVQPVGEAGLTIRWTSAFADGRHAFVGTQQGDLLNGHGPVLEATVQWSVHDAEGEPVDTPSDFAGIGFRGSGFTPDGVDGGFVTPADEPNTAVDPRTCGVDPHAGSYGAHTVHFQFTTLHQPGRRPIAKGNVQLATAVAVGEVGTATLGVNLHVATGEDPEP